MVNKFTVHEYNCVITNYIVNYYPYLIRYPDEHRSIHRLVVYVRKVVGVGGYLRRTNIEPTTYVSHGGLYEFLQF